MKKVCVGGYGTERLRGLSQQTGKLAGSLRKRICLTLSMLECQMTFIQQMMQKKSWIRKLFVQKCGGNSSTKIFLKIILSLSEKKSKNVVNIKDILKPLKKKCGNKFLSISEASEPH